MAVNFEKKRWIYLVLGMILSVFCGIGYAWSVFQRPLMAKFGWSLKSAALIYTAQILMSTLTPMVLGHLRERMGTRKYLLLGSLVYGGCLVLSGYTTSLATFFLTFSVGVGIGIGMLNTCIMAYGVKLFPEKRGIASGLLAGSYGAGAIIWAPVSVRLSALYGILNVYKILGVVFFVAIAATAVFLADPPDDFAPAIPGKKLSKDAGKKAPAIKQAAVDLEWRQMLKTGRFYLVVAIFSLGTTAGLMIMGHASPMLQDRVGLSPETAALIVGILAVCNAGGRIVWGGTSDRLGRPVVLGTLFLLVTLAMAGMYFLPGSAFIAAILLLGFCYGGFASLIAPTAADAFGVKHVTVNYNFIYVSYGVGGVVGPQVAAAVRDATGGYTAAFLVVACLSVVGFLLTLVYSFKKPAFSRGNSR
jgi:MFS transporter, OFA family, oxalate/formate antiporter